jgi:hypothetical protein
MLQSELSQGVIGTLGWPSFDWTDIGRKIINLQLVLWRG